MLVIVPTTSLLIVATIVNTTLDFGANLTVAFNPVSSSIDSETTDLSSLDVDVIVQELNAVTVSPLALVVSIVESISFIAIVSVNESPALVAVIV